MLKELQNKNASQIECWVTLTKRAFWFCVPSSLIQRLGPIQDQSNKGGLINDLKRLFDGGVGVQFDQ